MKNTNFYPNLWQAIPFSLDLAAHWDAPGKRALDVTLKSEFASQQDIAGMRLNIKALSIVDNNGRTHFINDFTKKTRLNIKGAAQGHFVKTNCTIQLAPGTYTAIRIFLKEIDNWVIYNDKRTEPLEKKEYLDFEIQNDLTLKDAIEAQLLMRFNLVPIKQVDFLGLLKNLITKPLKANYNESFIH